MNPIHVLLDAIRHPDVTLINMTRTMGPSLYLALFAIVFCETGLVVTPFLPGDSLLFSVGVLCAMNPADLHLPVDGFMPSLPVAMAVMFSAALTGDCVNYFFGKFVGPRVFSSERSLLFNKKHLVRTQLFYEKYGNKAIVMARFVPIVRTFAPFVAGIGQMTFRRFISYSVFGAGLWVCLLMPLGYKFAASELVKKRFELVILAIIFLSVLPMIVEIARGWLKSKSETPAAES